MPEISPGTPRRIRKRQKAQFLKGPIPLTWLQAAARLPGRALHLGLLIWFRAGLKQQETVRIPVDLLRSFGLDRDAKRRSLQALEAAGLVTVHRLPGRPADITLRMGPAGENTDHLNGFNTDREIPGKEAS